VAAGSVSFGTALRRLRARSGLTQDQLAERAGLSAKAISALERGERQRPYPHTVRALAGALNLSAQERDALESTKRSRQRRPTLPSPLARLIGRDDELNSVAGLVTRGVRLLTLVGAGGIGKTRLALAVGE